MDVGDVLCVPESPNGQDVEGIPQPQPSQPWSNRFSLAYCVCWHAKNKERQQWVSSNWLLQCGFVVIRGIT